MPGFSTRDADDIYQVSTWGAPYVSVSKTGTLQVHPHGDQHKVDLMEIIEEVRDDMPLPLVLRFPQILHHRVQRLHDAFAGALKENGLKDVRYRGVFPIKVNQRREVVQEIAKAGRKLRYGLEVGSKAELLAALTMDPSRKSLLIVNGFKDRDFLEAACHATAFKDEVIIVLDEVGELPHLLPLLDKLETKPILGIRLKLRSKAPGKWALSGGEKAKFGLTIPEVLYAVEQLKEAGHLDALRMLHFHIGSQISQIRRMSAGVREAARIYVELQRMGVPIQMLDVGGGMAVDYDGSASSSPNSCNYTVEEYASTVVATIKDVCEEADMPMPDLISESGRAVAAHHAVLVTEVLRRIPFLTLEPDSEPQEDDPTPLYNLYEAYKDLNAKTVFETFHDAVAARDDLNTLFDLGHLGLEALGRAERLTRAIFRRVAKILEAEEETESEEYGIVKSILRQKIVANFSLFQSVPDIWGVSQQFPIVPVHRLREEPTEYATIADITCDSDGEIRKFPDAQGTKPELPIHELRAGQPYYLGTFLVGAYQDTLGDYHNLFGETNEVFIQMEKDGTWSYGRPAEGSRVSDMLEWVRYEPSDMKRRIRARIQRLKENGRVTAEEARQLTSLYVGLLDQSTYLEVRL